MISAEDLASQLGQSRAEAAELNARLNQFVRNSIDSMLAQRLLHDQVGGWGWEWGGKADVLLRGT